MRPQAAMILCDWDRDHVLRQLPEATWMGRDWENPWREHPHLDEAAQILSDEADHLEIVVHGLGHEWWGKPQMERAEWADPEGHMRPRHLLERHIEAYAAILERNGLGPLPPFFVPCAFRHAFGEDEDGIQRLLADSGVTYVSTPFSSLRQVRAPQSQRIAVECGVMTVDRGSKSPSWKEVAAEPPSAVDGAIVGLHWPNILHEDPARNEEVIETWVTALRQIGRAPDRWLAPDTPSAWRQLAHAECTSVHESAGGITFDFSRLDALPPSVPLDDFVIKVTGGQRPRLATGVTATAVDWDGTCWVLACRR
jgi:hypothetical protein